MKYPYSSLIRGLCRNGDRF
ncbi:hypothetical protein EKH80_03955 [Dyella choica]|uniref:Uncharacterized protein n=1 Tax=Dyella choica TaxID=1927959 RepID=A0A3S0Q6T3_9GAMM|nr:hypothetical protein EKH80_03955 [Dyella choica]